VKAHTRRGVTERAQETTLRSLVPRPRCKFDAVDLGLIEDVVTIGPILAKELRAAGIRSREALQQLGAMKGWERLSKVNPDRDCASSLLALEGGSRGGRWLELPDAERKQIAEYVAQVKRSSG